MTESAPTPDVTVDTTGRFCPVPIIETAKAIRGLEKGKVVEVIATDPGVESDMPAWCKATKNEYLGLFREGKVLRAYVRKS
ncbi:MAG: sulfurtransferase TusA family protein [Myxococcales bacterium]